VCLINTSIKGVDKQIVSYESIVKEEELKKIKVLDYHFNFDSSRNLPQLI
jgi:hypothetical protein